MINKKRFILILLCIIFVMLILGYIIYNSLLKRTTDEKITYIDNSDYLYDIAIEYLKNNSNDNYKNKEDMQNFFTYKDFGISKDGNYKYAYMWIYEESYYVKDGKLYLDSGSVMPYKFTFKDDEVLKYDVPQDGSYYSSSIKEIFPKDLSNKILEFDHTTLNEELQKKVNEHYSYLDSTNVNYESHEKYSNKIFVKTYNILHIAESNDKNYLYLTIRKFQDEEVETVKVLRDLADNIEVNGNYEFTFQYETDDIEDNIKSIFENSTIISIVKTDKIGLNQIQDSIK